MSSNTSRDSDKYRVIRKGSDSPTALAEALQLLASALAERAMNQGRGGPQTDGPDQRGG